MPSTMLVHDTRLAGTAPAVAENTYRVNGSVSLKHAFGWMADYANSKGGLTNLGIMCHGLEGLVYDSFTSECTGALGFGLLLCSDNLTSSTLSMAYTLTGLVDTITIYACGPANTRSGFSNTIADGFRFCSELAAITGAEVVAATDTQYYRMERSANIVRSLFNIGPQDNINFGAWEGFVYRFSPDGTATPLSF